MSSDPATLSELHRGTLAELLGIRFLEASPDRVVAELPVRDALTTVGGAVHGGALMALAPLPLSRDVVGAGVGPLAHNIDARWLMAYAAGLGETDPRYFDTLAPGGPAAHPLFPVCYEWPVLLALLAHGRAASMISGAEDGSRRRFTTAQIASATVAASGCASISTQRSGSRSASSR